MPLVISFTDITSRCLITNLTCKIRDYNMKESRDLLTPQKKKILQPTLNFLSKLIQIGEDETSDKISVSELVPSGHLLVHFPNFDTFAKKGYEKATIALGENSQWSEDEQSIVATVTGYPKVIKTTQKGVEGFVTKVDIEPLFIISPDKMNLTVALHPPLKEGRSLQNQNIRELLTEQGIQFGIDEKALANLENFLENDENEFKKFSIAKGQPTGESTDAYLRFEIEIGPIAGTVFEDGTIDYRERRIMVGVSNEQVIATKIPAVQGEPGINVFGEENPAREGKDLVVKLLNDAKFSLETMQVTAKKDGVLSIVNNNIIKVLSHQKITTDINYETGNVNSRNCLTIDGSIQPGFSVSAGGDVKIAGGIMSGLVNCDGNLVVKGGITGKKSAIITAGDVDISFIEQGRIQCGGICVIRKQSYYSSIEAGSDLRCKDPGIVMGGNIVAEGNISLWDVGGDNATPATIAAGVVPERLRHFIELKRSVIQQQEDIIKWLQLYPGTSKSKKVKNMEQELAETKLLLLRVNLIPGTGIYSRVAEPSEEKDTNNPDYDNEGGIDIQEIAIDVKGQVYAGTDLRVGNKTLKLDKTISNRKFKLHANGKRIMAVPLRK